MRATRLLWFTFSGMALGMGLGIFLAVVAPLLYPLIVGGQQPVTVPSLVILYELTMFGTVVATLVGFVLEMRPWRTARRPYWPGVVEGETYVVIEPPPDFVPERVAGVLEANGGELVELEEAAEMSTVAPEARPRRRGLILVATLVVLALLIIVVAQIFTGCWIPFPSSMEYQVSVGYVEPPRGAAPKDAVAFANPGGEVGVAVPLNPVTPSAESVAAGKARYTAFCQLCHGDPKKAPGPVGRFFKPPPPGLAAVTPALSDGQIYQAVTAGFGRMPALASRLMPYDRWNVVNYLRSVAPSTQPSPGPAPSNATLRAVNLFATNCAQCHGATAEGAFAPGLRPSSFVTHATDAQVSEVVHYGRKGRGMPAFAGVLTDAQISDLVALLKRLQTPEGQNLLQQGTSRSTTTTTPPATTTTTLSPTTTTTVGPTTTTTGGATTTTTADLTAAKRVFDANCQGCHGPDGAGGGIGPQLHPNPALAGMTDAQITTIIENGFPGTAMPAWKGRLTDQEIAGLVALLKSWQAAGATDVAQAAEPQTIPFRHDRHVKNGVQCVFCHSGVLRGPAADLPPLALCAGCHRAITTQNDQTKQVVAAYDKRETVSWKRVYNLPDYVYFSHLPHVVTARVDCSSCHGDVGTMQLARGVRPMRMGFCLNCHRQQPNKLLRDCDTCHK